MRSRLPEGWEEVKLEEISKFNINNYRKNDDWEFVNYLDTGNITNGVVDEINLINLNEEKLPSRARRKVNKDDVIYSTVRPIQKHLGIIKKPLKNMLVSTGFTVITSNKEYLNPNYLYYYLNQNPLTQHLQSIAEQRVSTYPALNISDIKTLEIKLPPIKEQKVIANTLSTLDDKIELNNKINENLEEQAQAIFKHWFVDFEFPNENGKPYKSSGGQMIESELGRIPKGWEVIKLENLVENTKTGNWGKGKKEGNYTEEILCLRGADIPEIKKGNEGSMPKRYIIPKNLEEKALEDGDIVVEMSGGSPTQSTGRSVYINKELLDSYPVPLLCTNFCRVLNVKKEYKKMFYYNWEYLYSLGHMFSFENGTTGIKNLDLKSLLENNKITNPSTKILLKFNKYISTINTNKIKLGTQNQKLSQLRDTLLPKLMSGEIRIPLE